MSYKKFTKDIGLLGLTQIITALSGIISLPVITKILGAENYGIWAQLMVTIGLLTPLASMDLPYTVVRFLAGEKNKKEIQDGIWSVFAIILGISIIILIFFICFSGPISKFFGCSKIFVQLLPLIIMFGCLNLLFSNVFRAFQQIKEYCFFTIFQNLGETGLIVLTIFSGHGLFGAVLSVLIMQFITFVMMGVLILKETGVKIPKFVRIKEYLSFGLPAILSDMFSWVVQASDRYFIGFFMGTIFVGYYAPAYTLGSIIGFFMAPLIFLLPATLSKHHDENEIGEVKNYLKYSLKYFLMIGIPAFFGLSILSKQLLTSFSTPIIAQNSYFIVSIIAFSTLLSGVYSIIVQIIVLKKKNYISGIIWFLAALLNFGLNFIFVPRFGILGAAITTLLAYTFAFIAALYYSFKEIVFEIDWKTILKSILASVFMTLFIIWLKPLGFYNTILSIIYGVIIYGILILSLKCFDETEIIFVKKFLAKD